MYLGVPAIPSPFPEIAVLLEEPTYVVALFSPVYATGLYPPLNPLADPSIILPLKLKVPETLKAITPPATPLKGGVVIEELNVRLEYCGTLTI